MTTSQSQARAQVLLLAAAPRRSRRRLLDPELGVNAFAAIPTTVLLPGWTGPVDVVQLVDPGEPQAVLARLQAAAEVEGPLMVYVCGQLIRDHRQHQVHLALAKTTETTVRYTALPWAWMTRVLANRQPGTTAMVLDLIADPSCIPMTDADLQLPPQVARWGVVAPPAKRGPWQAPAYTVALASLLLRAVPGQHLGQLHPFAAGQAELDPHTVVLSSSIPAETIEMPRPRPAAVAPPQPQSLPADPNLPERPHPVTPTSSAASVGVDQAVADLRPAIAEAMRAGRHHEAAEIAAQWERNILRTRGRESIAMGDVLEVQAATAAASGAIHRATERWITTAEHRLQWHHPGHQAVQLAVRNALHCWRELDDDEPELADQGKRLAELLHSIGREPAAASVQTRITELQGPSYTLPPGWTR